ncbi:MFS transporter [Paenarthrobacter sp. NPDC058040]|uniref:MFS transporter n=1 Tax=unclassified Paenarthrobacter TaxID=2634190 RepID=UPI0036DB13AE
MGSTVEFYDLVAYGTAAAFVFGPLFFSSASPQAAVALSFATFASGYLVRPLGGLIFGFIADTRGRRFSLILTMLFMGGATVLMGLLPTHETLGDFAAILLVTLRLVQGLAVGGEQGGAMTLAVEHSSAGRSGFFGSFATAGTQAGTVLATGVFALVSLLPNDQFMSWGWRIPFLASAVIVLVAMFVRNSLHEAPEFVQSKSTGRQRSPIRAAFSGQLKQTLGVMFVYASVHVGWYVLTVFSLSFAVQSGVDRTAMLWVVAGAALAVMFMNPVWGSLSDRFGRKKLIIVGLACYAITMFLYFGAVSTGNLLLIMTMMITATATGHAALNGITPAFFIETLPVDSRATVSGLGMQLAAVLGGFVPLIATALVTTPWGITAVTAGTALVFAVSAVSALVLFPRPDTRASRESEMAEIS